MPSQGFEQTLVVAQVDGAASNAAAITSLLPPAALYTFPSNFFAVGSTIRISARGRITSNTTGAAGTLTIVPVLGSANIGFTTNAIALTAGAVNASWEFECIATCRAIGNGSVGSFIATGSFTAGAATANTTVVLPIAAPTALVVNATTATMSLDLQYLFSTGTASESIQLHQYVVESMN